MPNHDFDEYFNYYVSLVDGVDINETLIATQEKTQLLINELSEKQGSYAYANGKWTIKQLLCHLIDAERIFCNRALRFARNDSTDLPGYDHDEYVKYDNSKNRTIRSIAEEYEVVRASTICLFQNFSEEMLKNGGTANGKILTVGSIGLIISGHEKHHVNILKERYLA